MGIKKTRPVKKESGGTRLKKPSIPPGIIRASNVRLSRYPRQRLRAHTVRNARENIDFSQAVNPFFDFFEEFLVAQKLLKRPRQIADRGLDRVRA